MLKSFLSVSATALLAGLCFASPAFAQSLPETQLEQTSIFSPYSWNFNIGGGVRVAPTYQGSEDYKVGPTTFGSVSYRNTLFVGPSGLGLDFLKIFHVEGLRAGPILSYRGGRKQSNDRMLKGLGNIGASIEAGFYFDYDLGSNFTFSGTYRHAITNANNGGIARIQLNYRWKPLDELEVNVGPAVDFGDGRYVKKWFGITPAQSIASGLPVYNPSGGPTGAGLYFTADYYLTDWMFVRAFGTVRRMIGDTSESPIVLQKSQGIAGLGLVYHWQGGN